jgi:uncharacterized protein (DUF111 family)
MLEVEQKNIRSELLSLMKEGKVDTKTEIEKFQLFERLNSVYSHCKEIRKIMNENFDEMKDSTYEKLVNIFKQISLAGKKMHAVVKELYNDYDIAIEEVNELNTLCNDIIGKLFGFKFYNQNHVGDFSLEKPEVFIGNALNESLQEMIGVGEKVVHIIKTFSYNHNYLLEKEK